MTDSGCFYGTHNRIICKTFCKLKQYDECNFSKIPDAEWNKKVPNFTLGCKNFLNRDLVIEHWKELKSFSKKDQDEFFERMRKIQEEEIKNQ